MAEKDWRSELEQKIQENIKRSREIHISCKIDGQDLYNILAKFKGTYSLHIHSAAQTTNAEGIQKLIERDYIHTLYIFADADDKNILRFILEGAKATTALRSLQLDGTSFTKEDYDIIDAALSANKSLTDLQISAPLFHTLKIHPAIAVLEIAIKTPNDIDNGEYIDRMFEGLEQNKTVKSFKLLDRSNSEYRSILRLNDNNCFAMGRCLSNNSTIEDFNITVKVENEVGCEYLADGFAKNTSISKLKLSMLLNDKNTHIFKRIFVENKTVTDLDLLHNGPFNLGELITDQSAIKILGTRHYDTQFLNYAISPNCKIENLALSLSVYHSELNPDLDVLLAKNTSIKKLSIETDALEHSVAFWGGLLKNNTVTHLTAYFEDKLPKYAAYLLFEYLKKNKSLVSLELTGNGFEDSPHLNRQLIEVLKTNTTLEKLYMPYIRVTERHDKRLVDVLEALRDNKSLTDVNWISPYCADLADQVLAKNEVLLNGGFSDKMHPTLIRNRELRLERIILIYNMVRCEHLMSLLPAEMWLIIINNARFPGISSALIGRIFYSGGTIQKLT